MILKERKKKKERLPIYMMKYQCKRLEDSKRDFYGEKERKKKIIEAKGVRNGSKTEQKCVNRTQTYPPALLVTKNILTDRTDHVIVSVEVNVALLIGNRT